MLLLLQILFLLIDYEFSLTITYTNYYSSNNYLMLIYFIIVKIIYFSSFYLYVFAIYSLNNNK